MTVIEKYYDTGTITIQFDYTRTVTDSKQTDDILCDTWVTPFSCKEDADEYLNNTLELNSEKHTRLPDIHVGMTLSEITEAVDNGLSVCWSNNNYHVIDSKSGYMIKCIPNGNCQYLTDVSGNLQEDSEEFFIEGKQ